MSTIWNFNLALGKLFDFVLYPFHQLNPFWGLALVSFITGAVMVLIFKYISHQAEIRKSKARVRGYFLEVWLYKHDFRTVIGAVGRILKANFRYMRYALAPLLVMIIPVLLIMAHLNLRYGYRPFKPGDKIILTAKSSAESRSFLNKLEVRVPQEIIVEAGSVKSWGKKEVSWRITATKEGEYEIAIFSANSRENKTLFISQNKVKALSPKKTVRNSFWDALFLPGEKPLLNNSSISEITLRYPTRTIEFAGIRLDWIWYFFILSIIAGLALKGVFKVEI